MTKNIVPIITAIIDTYGETIESVYTYGVNQDILLVVKKNTVSDLMQLSKHAPIKRANVQITMFTKEEFAESIDVFPVEFLDMKSNRVLQHGTDSLADITVRHDNLRHECEFTLRSTILKCRMAIIHSRTDFTTLVREAFPIIYASLKSILVLHNQDVPESLEGVLHALATLTGIQTKRFEDITRKTSVNESDFQHFIDTLNALTSHVNHF